VAAALRWLLPGFALAFLLLIEERLSGLAIMQRLAGVAYGGVREADHLNRSALGFALLGFAAALRLWLRGPRWAAFAFLAMLILLLAFFSSTTALLAAAVGLLLLSLTLWRRALGGGLLLAALLLAVPLMPLVAWVSGRLHLAEAAWVGLTGRSRAYVWDFVLDRVRERPLLGWGMDASASMPNFGVAPFFKFQDHVIPLHPHSVGLQLWLELGLIGVLLALPPLLLLWRRLARASWPGSAFLVATAGAVLVAGGLSVGLWQSRWLGLECLALLLPLLVRRGGEA
jgi:O-antigen ligase